MAGYLEQAIERMVMDRLNNRNNMRFSRWATSYRKGAAARIIEKIEDRRDQLKEEEQKRKARNRANSVANGATLKTALTIADVQKSERYANRDFLYGDGHSAKMRQHRMERAAAEAQADKEYAEWAKENPEEAKKQEDKRQKELEKYWARRRNRKTSDNIDRSAYYAGYEAGKAIGIDPQTGDKRQESKKLS